MRITSLILVFIALLAGSAMAADNIAVYTNKLEGVSARLLSSAKEMESKNIPLKFKILKSESIDKVYTRTAFYNGYKIVLSTAFMSKVVNDDENILAFALGHEIAHIILGHLERNKSNETAFVKGHLTREEEFDADMLGMKLALKSGYTFKNIISGLKNMMALGMEFSPYEGLSKEHPPWSERLKKLDSSQSKLWNSLSSFENGKSFLYIEEYTVAERCFKHVTEEFPSCYEAWANLGYARLMSYLEGFGAEDFRDYNIGHIVTGSFYKTPVSIRERSLFSSIDEELWYEAVGALMEAVRLNPNLSIAKSNLGLAYLLHPGGKDLGKAAKYFDEAIALAEKDTLIDFLAKSALYINSGVLDLLENPTMVLSKFDKAEEYERRFASSAMISNNNIMQIDKPIMYNKALALMKSSKRADKMKAFDLFEKFILRTNNSSPWRVIAYENYKRVATSLNIDSKMYEDFAISEGRGYKPLTTVELEPGLSVTLAESLESLEGKIKGMTQIPVVPKTNLKLYKSNKYGVEFLTGFGILGIFIKSQALPPIKLNESGFGNKSFEIKVGMKRNDFEKITSKLNSKCMKLIDSGDDYIYYREIGLAAKFNHKNEVSELVITKIGF